MVSRFYRSMKEWSETKRINSLGMVSSLYRNMNEWRETIKNERTEKDYCMFPPYSHVYKLVEFKVALDVVF